MILPIVHDSFVKLDTELKTESDLSYHSDHTCMSSSMIRKLLKSPRHFLHSLQKPEEDNEAFKIGRMAHMAILMPEEYSKKLIKMPNFGDQRSAKNKEAKAEFIAKHSGPDVILATQDESEMMDAIVNNLRDHHMAGPLLKNSIMEKSGRFVCPETFVRCKIKPDAVKQEPDGDVLIDIKTTHDASPSSFARSIYTYGYHIQMAFYAYGYQIITGRNVSKVAFVAIEKSAPYVVSVYLADEYALANGLTKVRRALASYRECARRNVWNGYNEDKASLISLPRYADYDEDNAI